MKISHIILFLTCFAVCAAQGENRWKTVSEGFRLTIPWEWQKEKRRGIDSHVGKYRGKTAYLEFDEVYGLGYTNENALRFIEELKKKEADSKLLVPGEEVWHVNGKIAHFTRGNTDPKIYGDREFKNVAALFVPYEGEEGYLHVMIFYESDKDLPVIRRILASIEWEKKPTPEAAVAPQK